jgi:hypothetical protein
MDQSSPTRSELSELEPNSDQAASATSGTYTYGAREAVGVFADPDMLEAAVDQLEVSGFDRATISVLATDETVKDRVGHLYHDVSEIADGRRVPQGAFVSTDSRVEGKAAAVGIPVYIGGVTAAGIVAVAFGGPLAAVIAAAVAGGAAGGGLGAILATAIGRHHADHVVGQIAQGGLVLWVSLRDDDAERRAVRILNDAGARDVHVHDLQREWTLKDRPLSETQFDPFLLGK